MKNYLYTLVTDQRNDFFAQILKLFLFLLSLVYGLIIRILIFIYSLNPYRSPCKVISVGNITLGGTGKTSLVELIARYLKIEGHKVAVISRGYKKRASSTKMGDEPDMLSKNLGGIPVLADKDRVRAIKMAFNEYKVDTVILDDALQQWRVKKDLEIVAIDVGNPFGNKSMLPRGILREPLKSLKRADIFVLTKTNLNSGAFKAKELLNKINSAVLVVEAMHSPVNFYDISKPETPISLEELEGKSVVLFSGIGDPKSFESLIKSLKINVKSSLVFMDHHNYTPEDITNILKRAQENNVDKVITTAKDAARLSAILNAASAIPILVLRIELRIKDEQRFLNRLSRVYSA